MNELWEAIHRNDGKTIRQAVEKMTAKEINNRKNSPLHLVCGGFVGEKVEALTALLRKPGIDVNIKDTNGITPIEGAVSGSWCKLASVKLLLSHPMIELKQGLEEKVR